MTGDLYDLRRLYDVGIRAVLQVAYEEPPLALPHDFVACRFPLVDGGDNETETLDLAIVTLTHFLEQRFACLVCCQAGLSRSPGIAAASLARFTGQSFAECLALIGTTHRHAIHPKLLTQLLGQ